jgi:FkbM family methyltransferase
VNIGNSRQTKGAGNGTYGRDEIIKITFLREFWRVAILASDVFSSISAWHGLAPAGFDVNFVGQTTNVHFNKGWDDAERLSDRQAWPPCPSQDSETAEWECLLASLRAAGDQFVMIEAGAGYGRWSVGAACAARMLRAGLPMFFIGIEAEPRHFEWMVQHFRDNGLDPANHRLVQGAVAATDGEARFVVGDDPSAWYGQAMVHASGHAESAWPSNMLVTVKTFSLETLLGDVDIVDLLDCDIQGAEAEVIPAAMNLLNGRVKRAHIATHFSDSNNSTVIDAPLYELFAANGWRCEAHHPPNTTETIGGIDVHFDDGVQYWVNPRLT